MEIFGLGPSEILVAAAPAIALFVAAGIAGIILWRRAKTGANPESCATASVVMGVVAAIEGTFFNLVGVPFALILGVAAVEASQVHKKITGTNGNSLSTAGLILGIVGVAMCVIALGQTGVLVFSTGE